MPERNAHEYASALYDQLRSMARARMAGQRPGHTLDPTGLANEAIVRLLRHAPSQINDENHFKMLAAEAMRQILVDYARRRATQKRGGGKRPAPIDADDRSLELQLQIEPLELIALSEALDELEGEAPDAAAIVKMRTFVGLDAEETAALLNLSRRTIERRWRYAMAELRVRLGDAAAKAASSAASFG
jgi:RNA polymerase sigma factor (TIGR02999 family)